MSQLDFQLQYDIIVGAITSPLFRNPIKNFIDKHCGSFLDVDENTIEQGNLFTKFNQLVESLLENVLKEYGLTEESFALIAEKGLKHPQHSKYFNQLVSMGDYNYFKSIMMKRNYQLVKQLESKMQQKENAQKKGEGQVQNQRKANEESTEAEKKDIEKAIKLSLQMRDKERRMEIIEKEELKVFCVYYYYL